MPNWFYYDNNARKIGPMTPAQLQELAARRIIVPETYVETDDGKQGQAVQVNWLSFPAQFAMPPVARRRAGATILFQCFLLSLPLIAIGLAYWYLSGGTTLISDTNQGKPIQMEPDTALILDTQTGKKLGEITGVRVLYGIGGEGEQQYNVEFSPDGKKIRVYDKGDINNPGSNRILDTSTGRELYKIPDSSWEDFSFSPDGKKIAAQNYRISDKICRIINTETGKELCKITEVGDCARTFFDESGIAVSGFSPDGKKIAAKDKTTRTCRIIATETGKELFNITECDNLGFFPDWKRIATYNGNTCRILDAETGRKLLEIENCSGVCPSPDGESIAAYNRYASTCRILDAKTGKELYKIMTRDFLPFPRFFPNGKKIAMYDRDTGTYRILDAETGRMLFEIVGKERHDISFSPDGQKMAMYDSDEICRILNTQTGKGLLEITSKDARFSPDWKKIVTYNDDTNTYQILNAETGEELLKITESTYYRLSARRFSPDWKKMAVYNGNTNTCRILNAETGKELFTITNGDAGFSPDGKKVLAVYTEPKSISPKREKNAVNDVVPESSSAMGRRSGRREFAVTEQQTPSGRAERVNLFDKTVSSAIVAESPEPKQTRRINSEAIPADLLTPSPIRPHDDKVYYFNTTCIELPSYNMYNRRFLYIDRNNIVYDHLLLDGAYQKDGNEKKKIMANVRSVYCLGVESSGVVRNSTKTYYLITTNNDLWAWGDNSFGQVGDDTGLDKESPIFVMKDVANLYFVHEIFGATIFAIKIDKSRWGWGKNIKGTGNAYAPIKIDDYFNHNQQLLVDHISMQNGNPENYPLIELSEEVRRHLGGKDNIVSAISKDNIGSVRRRDTGRDDPTYYALTKDGVLWGWGYNDGYLGDGTKADRDVPVKIAENVRRMLPQFFITQFGDWYCYYTPQNDKYKPSIAYENCFYVYSNYDGGYISGKWFTPEGKLVSNERGKINVLISDIKLPSIVDAGSGQNIALTPKPFLPRTPEKADNGTGSSAAYGSSVSDRGSQPMLTRSIFDFAKSYNCDLTNVRKAVIDFDKKGETLLHKAALKGNLSVAKYLVSYGANVNARDNSGETPIHEAVQNHDQDGIEIARYLVSNGANVNVKDNLGNTPLHLVAVIKNGDADVVKVLIDNKADVNAKNNNGRTPLHRAAMAKDGSIEIVKVLVDNGADVNVKDKDGETPLEKAKKSENTVLEKYLSNLESAKMKLKK